MNRIILISVFTLLTIHVMAQEKIVQTAGRDQLGEFAPKFAELKKIGTLKETDAGYHTAENLLAGGYFIKESKAPEGYQPDSNAYYFSITEDGQVAVVENGEAGHGFTNEAYRGNLKITKDSSDGRKDGFAIEVKSADGSYCETFTTPKSGVIEVKGLRVGIYTVTEVANRQARITSFLMPLRWRSRQIRHLRSSSLMKNRKSRITQRTRKSLLFPPILPPLKSRYRRPGMIRIFSCMADCWQPH